MNQKKDIKGRIIETASILFHKQGYNNTGINQIIKEANIAKASLYYHFKTKEDLCIAYLEERNILWKKLFFDYISNKEDKVSAAFDFLIIDNENSNYRGCSFLNMLTETPPEKKNIFKILRNHKKELLSFFEDQISDSSLAYTVYSLFENSIIEGQLHQSSEPILRLKKIVSNLMAKS